MRKKQIVKTEKAPAAIGPYSQAIVAGDLIFVSGQIPLNPETGEFVSGGIVEQSHQVLQNLAAVLEAAGSGLDRVIKTTVYVSDMSEFAALNEVYGQYFNSKPPARATILAAGLPRGARVEIEAIALA